MLNRLSTIEDVDQIVRIHQLAFPGFFLTSLGTDFLSFYYSSFIRHPETVCLVATDEEKIVGFSAATIKSKGFNSRLIKSNLISFLCWSFKMLITNHKALVRLGKNLTKKSEAIPDDGDYAELFSIGVSPECQGKGAGSLLLSDTETLIRDRGVSKLSLTTDLKDNESAIAFYKRNGYNVLYEFTAYPDRRMYRFIKELL